MSKQYYLITGGCGFIGTNFIEIALKKKINIINLDKLSYASNYDLHKKFYKNKNYKFYKGDYSNYKILKKIFLNFNVTKILNFAAETHVDNSIYGPIKFIKNNVLSFSFFLQFSLNYFNRLNEKKKKFFKFVHVSTDEVYGSLKKKEKSFNEKCKFYPNSPYSASKAASDGIARAWNKTYGLPVIITNCSNNYGIYQNKEKLIPKTIHQALNNKIIPVYGNGKNIRDWMHVSDHCNALLLILEKGKSGETYNIGGRNEIENIKIVKLICSYLDKKVPLKDGTSYLKFIKFVKDRLGHDFRYSVNFSKLKEKLDWEPKVKFSEGIQKTVDWYIKNTFNIKSK
jgi:dTDP-glucose 4,6-dehydratase